MNRREWMRRAALIAGGAVAADQLDVLDRLGHALFGRRSFPSATVWPEHVVGEVHIVHPMGCTLGSVQIDSLYGAALIVDMHGQVHDYGTGFRAVRQVAPDGQSSLITMYATARAPERDFFRATAMEVRA